MYKTGTIYVNVQKMSEEIPVISLGASPYICRRGKIYPELQKILFDIPYRAQLMNHREELRLAYRLTGSPARKAYLWLSSLLTARPPPYQSE